MSLPKVSIIIPSYNHRTYIGALIDSIYAQTFKDFELIIVDDGSKDGSQELLKELSYNHDFQLILKDNEGLCATLNRGLSLAQGEYIINIGSDDIIPPNRLYEQVEFMEKHQDVDVVAGCMHLIDERGKKCGDKIPAKIGIISFEDMVVTNRVFAPTAMIRATVFKKFGLYPTDFLMEDYYLWLKLLKEGGKICNTKHFWAFYRISNQNLEKKFTWYYKGSLQAIAPYASSPNVAYHLNKKHFLYCIKMGLLLGHGFLVSYRDIYYKLNYLERFIARLVSYLPFLLRDQILIFFKLKTY